MSIIRLNVIANFAGKAWAALMSLAFVPFYLRFLGIEAYGLIGFYLTLAATFSLLDLGLGTTLNRRLAQLSVQTGNAQEMRDLLRTLEAVYWPIGIAIGITVVALAPFIAGYWIKSQQLSADSVAQAVGMMGIAIACQWPLALYSGGLMGMQKQVASSAVSSLSVTIRNVGAVLVIWQIAPTVQAFFAWQIAVSLTETLASGLMLWRFLPAARARAGFRTRLLEDLWRFAAGMTGISVMAVILTQLDKVILSKVLSLEAFGYYSLAWRVAAGLYYLAGPVNAAFFPRFSQLAVLDERKDLARLYHSACQLLSVILLPVTAVLALFPMEFLLLWTNDAAIAANSAATLRLLMIGTAINALMILPLGLQLAHGWTRLVFYTNSVAVIVLAPMIYFMSLRYGGVGAAWMWIILNCGYVIFMLQMMHRRLLPGHLREWFLVDVGLPLCAVLAVAGLWKQMIGLPGPYGWMLFNLAAVSLLTALAAAFAAPQIRALLMRRLLNQARRKAEL